MTMSKVTVINRIFRRNWILITYFDPLSIDYINTRNYPPRCPGVYVLGVSKGRGPKKIIYVGQSCGSLYSRIVSYATRGGHIAGLIYKYLQEGYSLYYKYRECRSNNPIDLEADLLSRFNFPCNCQKNGGHKNNPL